MSFLVSQRLVYMEGKGLDNVFAGSRKGGRDNKLHAQQIITWLVQYNWIQI